jgi:hypothetical protein
MALYVASIYIRNRNLNQDVAMLEEMDKVVAPAKAKVAGKPQKKKTVTKKTGKK